MQRVPALRVQPIAPQLIETSDAPDIGANTVIFFQQFCACDHFTQNRAAAEQLHLELIFFYLARTRRFAQQIHAAQNAFFHAIRHRRVRVVFVHHGDVIEHVFLFLIHAPHAVLNDHCQLIGVRWIVGDAVGNGGRHDVAVAVFMLQPFTVQRGASRSAAEQEAARAHIARRPRQIANALKAEHRVENIKRNHHLPVRAVRRCSSYPGRHCARFVDTFLKNLTCLVFLIEHQLVSILRRVKLAYAGVNAELTEHALHAKRA